MKSKFLGRTLISTGLLSLALASAAQADGHLTEVVLEREGADFNQYHSILVRPLDLSDVKVNKPAWEMDDPEEWNFESGTGAEIQDLYMTNIATGLSGENGLMLTDVDGPGVIQLEVEFLSITPYTRPGSRSGDVSGYEISTLGSGDVHISAELRDAETGALLLLIEGERAIGTEYKELTPENHIENLRETFTTWGVKVREYIGRKQAG